MADQTILIPSPSFHVDLSGLDARHPVHYSRRLLIFRCASSAQRDAQLTALKTGLRALVSRCPLLGGVVVPLPSEEARQGKQDWRTIVPGQGFELVVRDLQTAMPSFEELKADGFRPDRLPYNLLVPVPQDLGNDRPYAACKMQFSSIEGGSIITWAMSHTVADGVGHNELMRVLAEETRLAQERPGDSDARETRPAGDTTSIGLDRTKMRNMTSDVSFNIQEHPAYRLHETPPTTVLPQGQTTPLFEATESEVPVLLQVSAASLAQLKADATTPDAPPISTHDALSALIWRSVLLVRSRRSSAGKNIPASSPGHIFMPSDARRHLNLPSTYIGNAVYQLTATLALGTLFSPTGLKHAASALRRAITAVNPPKVASLLAETNKRWIDWGFLETMSATGVAMGTDWTSGELYAHDWGKVFGPLITYRCPGEEGLNYILPKLPDGGADVLVCVMPNEVEMVRSIECFGNYLEIR